jgi:hypothetical protein
MDAYEISTVFDWPLFDIVIKGPAAYSSFPAECWLKTNMTDNVVDKFVKNWDGKYLKDNPIACRTEEDTFDLCKKFRIGHCETDDVNCHWIHTMCTANGRCPENCPYGHCQGVKDSDITLPSMI